MRHRRIDRRGNVVTAIAGGLWVARLESPRHPAPGCTQRGGRSPWAHRPSVGVARNLSAAITDSPVITSAVVNHDAMVLSCVIGASVGRGGPRMPSVGWLLGRGRPRRAAHRITRRSWRN